jgi:GntR family transcriptional regulator
MSNLKYFLELISVSSLIRSFRPRQYGNLVAESPNHLEPIRLTGMIEEILAMGIKTRTKVLNFDFVHPPKKVAENLKLNGDARVLRIERIRWVKEKPISFTVSYVPSDLGEKISVKDLSVQPLLNVLEDKCRVKIIRGSQIIKATEADPRTASFLEVITGTPLLKIERVVFDIKSTPVEYVSIFYRSDRYHYAVDFMRKRPESRAQRDYIKV